MYSGLNLDGFWLVLITILIVIVMFITNRYKLVKKIKNYHFYWVIIGVFCLAWLLTFRFIPSWKLYIDYANSGSPDPGTYGNSNIISRAWLLDACPFAGLTICVLIIIDPSRKLARSFAPIALVGGIITIGSMLADVSTKLSIEYIFFGDKGNECYFFLHFVQIVIPIGIMLNTPRGGWKAWVLCLLMAIIYYSYVAIIKTITGADWFVSGLSLNDWKSGEYYAVHEIFSFIPINAMPFVGIPSLYILASGFMALKDYVFDKGKYKYGNAFSGKWYYWYDIDKFVKQNIV